MNKQSLLTGIFLSENPFLFLQLLSDHVLETFKHIKTTVIQQNYLNQDSSYQQGLSIVCSLTSQDIETDITHLQKQFPHIVELYNFTFVRYAMEYSKVLDRAIQKEYSRPPMREFLYKMYCLSANDSFIAQLSFLSLPLSEQYFALSRIVRSVLNFYVNMVGFDNNVPVISPDLKIVNPVSNAQSLHSGPPSPRITPQNTVISSPEVIKVHEPLLTPDLNYKILDDLQEDADDEKNIP
jgi:hypothetical protein